MRRQAWFLGAFLLVFTLSLAAALHSSSLALAQSTDTSSSDSSDTSGSTAVSTLQAQLQSQLDAINAQITQQQAIVTQEEQKSQSLQSTIAILNAQIKSAQLAIQARNLTIEQLTSGIGQKQSTVDSLNTQLSSEQDSLGGILREENQLENSSLVVAMLSSDSLSSFFSDLDNFDEIKSSLQGSFDQISSTTAVTQTQETDLETQRTQESQLLQVQQLQEGQIAAQQAQENDLLSETKGEEANYQKLITANQQTASQIRTELFQLTGSSAISFGDALDFANVAAAKTGIRPAFLLGIIKEESDLGSNVGTGNYLTDMNPTRDVPVFLAITQSLGLDPSQMPVSAKAWYGWGGAMGPAQFIPSTWALYAGYQKPNYQYNSSADRIGPLTGDTPPNPWNPKDAFMASALYLTDDNADAKTPAAEFKAAMCYLAGCGNVDDQSLWFYGNQVLCNELQFQEDIDTINGTNDAAAMKANTTYYGQC